MANKKKTPAVFHHSTKKCPYCMLQMKVTADKCEGCGRKLGNVNRFGLADKPVNWKAYIVSTIAWIAFGVYIWWAFLRD